MFFLEVYKTELRGEATQAYADGAGGLCGAWFQEFHWGYLRGGCAKAAQGLPTTLFGLFAYGGAGAVKKKTQLKWSALWMPRGQVAGGEKHVAQTWKKTECGAETSLEFNSLTVYFGWFAARLQVGFVKRSAADEGWKSRTAQRTCKRSVWRLSGEDSEDSEDSPAVLGSSDRDLRRIPAGKAQQETVKATFSECLKQARKIRDTHPAVLRGRIIIDQ